MNRLNYALAFLFVMQIGQSFSLKAQDLPGIVTDTLNWVSYQTGTETLYQSPNGGYVFGNNGYGDQAKAQVFNFSYFGKLEKVLFKFGAKRFHSLDPTSKLNVGLHKLDGVGVSVDGGSLVAPGTLISDSISPGIEAVFSGSIFVSDIDTSGGFTEFEFPVADSLNYTFSSAFAVVVYLSELAVGDTVGLMSTLDGDAGMLDNAWDRHGDGTWISVLNSDFGWDLDIDMAIFPVMTYNSESPVGISETAGNQVLQFYPNPASSELTITWDSNSIIESLSLFSLDGRFVQGLDARSGSGNQSIMDVSSLQNGTYFLRSNSPIGPSFNKIQIIH
jgi:hypothetical protein